MRNRKKNAKNTIGFNWVIAARAWEISLWSSSSTGLFRNFRIKCFAMRPRISCAQAWAFAVYIVNDFTPNGHQSGGSATEQIIIWMPSPLKTSHMCIFQWGNFSQRDRRRQKLWLFFYECAIITVSACVSSTPLQLAQQITRKTCKQFLPRRGGSRWKNPTIYTYESDGRTQIGWLRRKIDIGARARTLTVSLSPAFLWMNVEIG